VILDGREVPNGGVLAADVCVIGGGAAGITMALQLAGKSTSVIILESGGLNPDVATQSLYKGEITGLPNYPLEACRLRYFGGSTGHWGGWCRPFDPIDFEQRSWVPGSGWPIAYEELAKFYPRAHEICHVSDMNYDPAGWDLSATPPFPLSGSSVETKLIQFSLPIRFGTVYRPVVEQMKNVRVFLHTNATSIDLSANAKRVDQVSVAVLNGNRFSVRAKHYVVATGGIENARLLLASNQVRTAGVGNAHDQVGRYFMDHIQLDSAQVLPIARNLDFTLYQTDSRHSLRRSMHPGAPPIGVMGYLKLSEEAQRQARTLNYSACVYQSYWLDYFLHSDNPDNRDKSLWRITSDAVETVWKNLRVASSMALERLPGRGKHPFYKIMATQEQAPNPDSRVLLSRTRDALNIPHAELHWELLDVDRYTLMEALRQIAIAFGTSHLARLNVPMDFTKQALPTYMRGSWHHYGTTRMSDDPRTGVVDRDCKVHDVANLFIAGCSVFPTSGNGNPTLSIVAMTARLAEHLQRLTKRA
jgi:choline dehydrogenase-like flavoprotein